MSLDCQKGDTHDDQTPLPIEGKTHMEAVLAEIRQNLAISEEVQNIHQRLQELHLEALTQANLECPRDLFPSGEAQGQAVIDAYKRHLTEGLQHIQDEHRKSIESLVLNDEQKRARYITQAQHAYPMLGHIGDLLVNTKIDLAAATALKQLTQAIQTYATHPTYQESAASKTDTFADPDIMARNVAAIAALDPAFLSALTTERLDSIPRTGEQHPPRRASFLTNLEVALQTEAGNSFLPQIIRSLHFVAQTVTDLAYNIEQAKIDSGREHHVTPDAQRLFTLITHGLGSQPHLFLHLANSGYYTQFSLDKFQPSADTPALTPAKKTAMMFAAIMHDFMGKNSTHILYYSREIQEYVVQNKEMLQYIFDRLPHIAKRFEALNIELQDDLRADPDLMIIFLDGHWREIGDLMAKSLYDENRGHLFTDEYMRIIRRHDSMAGRGLTLFDILPEFTVAAELHHAPPSYLDALRCKNWDESKAYFCNIIRRLNSVNIAPAETNKRIIEIETFYKKWRPKLEKIVEQAYFFTSIEELLLIIQFVKANDGYEAMVSRENQRGRPAGALSEVGAICEMVIHSGTTGSLPPQFHAHVIDPLVAHHAPKIRAHGDSVFRISPRSYNGIMQQMEGVAAITNRITKFVQIVWGQEIKASIQEQQAVITNIITQTLTYQKSAMDMLRSEKVDPNEAPHITITFCPPVAGTAMLEVTYGTDIIGQIELPLAAKSSRLST